MARPAAGGPPDSPDAPLCVELPQCEALERVTSGRGVRPDPVDVPEPAEDGFGVRDGPKRDPFRAARIGDVGQLAVVDLPAAKDEVEVAAAIRMIRCWNDATHARLPFLCCGRSADSC